MKKGFTLAELLGVIVILGIIALITTPVVTSLLNTSAEKTYKKQIDVIENVAKEWGVENSDYLPEIDSTSKKAITLETLISSGKIQNSSIIDPRNNEPMEGCVLVNYNSEYNQYEYKYNEDASYCEQLQDKLCTPVTEATTGNVPTAGQYNYGDEYICDLGDGESRTFYVLEDGDNTTLTKGDFTQVHYETDMVGTADTNEVALIMDRNYDNTSQTWCDQNGDNPNDAICNADGLTDKLNEIRTAWTKLNPGQIGLPTYAQIYVAAGNTTYPLPTWIYGNLDDDNSTTTPYLYWTSTVYSYSDTHNAWYVRYLGDFMRNSVAYSDIYGQGVRPVITISKDNL